MACSQRSDRRRCFPACGRTSCGAGGEVVYQTFDGLRHNIHTTHGDRKRMDTPRRKGARAPTSDTALCLPFRRSFRPAPPAVLHGGDFGTPASSIARRPLHSAHPRETHTVISQGTHTHVDAPEGHTVTTAQQSAHRASTRTRQDQDMCVHALAYLAAAVGTHVVRRPCRC